MAENDAEEGGKSGLIKKILIFGGGGFLLIAIGLGVGYVVFGSSQPDPSEQIEEIIERKMKEAEEAEAAADNATPQKQSKDSPNEEVFATIYHEFPGTFTTNLQGSRKMLQIGVGVSTQYDDTVMANVEAHQLALRSVILGVIHTKKTGLFCPVLIWRRGLGRTGAVPPVADWAEGPPPVPTGGGKSDATRGGRSA